LCPRPDRARWQNSRTTGNCVAYNRRARSCFACTGSRSSWRVRTAAASLLPQKPAGHGLQIIGQFSDLYIFCSNSEGLLVIDQHAAHERLLYEELRTQYLGRSVARQNLLFPETVELTLFQSQLVERHAEELDHMGFSIREFGGNSYLISAVPALAGQANPVELLRTIVGTSVTG
jgi:DNA mismatch repair protein MutL